MGFSWITVLVGVVSVIFVSLLAMFYVKWLVAWNNKRIEDMVDAVVTKVQEHLNKFE